MEVAKVNKRRIDSLQALRTFAFLGIFFNHARFFVSWAALGVSVFYILSGFLMAYQYENVDLEASPRNNLRFSINKIKKLYPLHILTMLCAISIFLVLLIHDGINMRSVVGLLGKTALNVTLLQTWVPYSDINVSLNGVAWYLSVTLFLYFMFPWIKKVIEKNSLFKLCVACVIILIVEVAACIPLLMILGSDSPVYIWFMYCFPVFRMGDFFIGCVLKRVFLESNIEKAGTAKATIFEILALAFTVWLCLWYDPNHSNIVLQAFCNWTTAYIPVAAIWVLLFAVNRGLITKALSNRFTIYIGNLSAYAFLIHFIITRSTLILLSYMNINMHGWSNAILIFAELALSILLSVWYKRLDEKYIAKYFFKKKQRA